MLIYYSVSSFYELLLFFLINVFYANFWIFYHQPCFVFVHVGFFHEWYIFNSVCPSSTRWKGTHRARRLLLSYNVPTLYNLYLRNTHTYFTLFIIRTPFFAISTCSTTISNKSEQCVTRFFFISKKLPKLVHKIGQSNEHSCS